MAEVAQEVALAPGLYVVATPIGTARDITLRALDILRSADVLVAEDTRTLRRLMEIHGIPLGDRPMLSYHDHNGAAQRPRLLGLLADGKSVSYASDAGTPLVADPGFGLVRSAIAAGFAVTTAPGPSAAITALTLAGLPTDKFAFIGFLPQGQGARRSVLESVKDFPGTLVIYESPRRCSRMLSESVSILGGEREAAVCRELTKKFEEVRRGTLQELAGTLEGETLKGEVVICIGKSVGSAVIDLDGLLRGALKNASLKDAVRQVTDETGLPRRQVYQAALVIHSEDEG